MSFRLEFKPRRTRVSSLSMHLQTTKSYHREFEVVYQLNNRSWDHREPVRFSVTAFPPRNEWKVCIHWEPFLSRVKSCPQLIWMQASCSGTHLWLLPRPCNRPCRIHSVRTFPRHSQVRFFEVLWPHDAHSWMRTLYPGLVAHNLESLHFLREPCWEVTGRCLHFVWLHIYHS